MSLRSKIRDMLKLAHAAKDPHEHKAICKRFREMLDREIKNRLMVIESDEVVEPVAEEDGRGEGSLVAAPICMGGPGD